HATRAKTDVQGTVGVVARQGEVTGATGVGNPRSDDLVVGLDGEAVGLVAGPPEVSGHPPTGAEVDVQAAVGVVTRQGEVTGATGVGKARSDDFAVGLDGDGECQVP